MTADTSGAGRPGGDVLTLVRDGALAGQWKLDPQASRVEFAVPHFWGAIKVRGWFERLEGDATVGPDGTVAGQLVMDVASLNTKNKQRDKHLRSADFFTVEEHPRSVLTVNRATLTGDGQLAAEGELEAAGVREPVSFTADIVDAGPDAVTLRAELTIDRSRFGMTWSPMRVASMQATGTVTARFVRAPDADTPGPTSGGRTDRG
jgi:polyisoprenoid-binding protein YceI